MGDFNITEFIPFLAAFILGLSKAGFKGLGFIVVILLAVVLEAKESTGVLMPMLITADCLAIYFYKKDVNWKILFKVLPAMLIGVLFGVFVGDDIPKDTFKNLMAAIVLISGVMMIVFDKLNSELVPDGKVFATSMGLGAGFSTMIGNLAGAFSNLYLLALRLPKRKFIGTAAWLFFIINLFKFPFHVCVWETITIDSLKYSLKIMPGVLIGFFAGIYFIQHISDTFFRKYIIYITISGAVVLFLI